MRTSDMILHDLLRASNILPSLHLVDQINAYLTLLDTWNKVYNLTAIQDPHDRMVKHIADSLSVAPYVRGARWLDVGSGAGLPGIPLALAFPEINWTLLDSHAKKIRFLTQVKAKLNLTNVVIVHARIEDYRATLLFDHVITRAWTSLAHIWDKTHSLLKVEGTILAMKGLYPTEELRALSVPYRVYPLSVPSLNEVRHLVEIRRG